jgi:hypothetical protein
MQKGYGKLAIAVSLVVAVFLGSALGPTIATAVGNLVTIKGPKGKHYAKVSNKGRLQIDSEAGIIGPVGNGFLKTFAETTPSGEVALLSSGVTNERRNDGIITGITVDVAPQANGPVTVIMRRGLQVIWRGTFAAGGGHMSDAFENGLYSRDGFRVIVTNPSGADVRYVVYGEGFGVSPIFGDKLTPAG